MKKYIPYILGFGAIVFSFRSLLIHFSSNLMDWFDYPYVAWVINQNIMNLRSADWIGLVNTNAFYPHTQALFFSDLLLPQSIIGIPISFLTNNPIIIFNTIFVITFGLNFVASYLFWNRIFLFHVATIISLLTIFSPFFYMERSHFQMMTYWPFFFGLYLYMRPNSTRIRDYIWAGIWAIVQFAASAYLGIFLLSSYGLYTLSELTTSKEKSLALRRFFITILVFVMFSFPLLAGYRSTQKQYQIVRPYAEYVIYSAHISDYLFTEKINGFLSNTRLLEKWNGFNKHMGGASGTGILLTILAIFGFGVWKKNKSTLSFTFPWSTETQYFFLIGILGLVFSLGPRLSVNGEYANIPLPYHAVIKFFPIITSLRATARWAWLFYIAVLYFAGRHITQIKRRSVYVLLLLLLAAEYFPLSLQTTFKNYWGPIEEIQKSYCSQKQTVVLHVPVTHLHARGGLAEGLSYITTNQFASHRTGCYLVNGYSGYDMPSLFLLGDKIQHSLETKDEKQLYSLARETGADIVTFDTRYLKLDPDFEKILRTSHQLPSGGLRDDESYYIVY